MGSMVSFLALALLTSMVDSEKMDYQITLKPKPYTFSSSSMHSRSTFMEDSYESHDYRDRLYNGMTITEFSHTYNEFYQEFIFIKRSFGGLNKVQREVLMSIESDICMTRVKIEEYTTYRYSQSDLEHKFRELVDKYNRQKREIEVLKRTLYRIL